MHDTQAKLIEAPSWHKTWSHNLCLISCVSWNYRGYSMHINIIIASPSLNLDLIFLVVTWGKDEIGLAIVVGFSQNFTTCMDLATYN